MQRTGRRGFVTAAAGALAALTSPGAAPMSPRGTVAAPDAGSGGSRRHAGGREFRGMWLATVANRDWPSRPGLAPAEQRTELLAHLDTAVARKLNAVVLQVRPTADSLWPSPYEPWTQYLTGVQGQDPGWDPLGTAVREAHRRGLELHAWFNPYRVAGHTDLSRLAEGHPARTRPEWVLPYGGKLYYNPGIPEVRGFVQDAMMDAVRRYDVDGVHFDDYFYPYPVAGQVFADDETYARYGAGFPDKASWRRDNIDRLVRGMARRIRRTGKDVPFGISPFGVWRNIATDPLGSDTTAGFRPTTISTRTPGGGSGRAGSTMSSRRSTGTSASPRRTTRSCSPGGTRSYGTPESTSTSVRPSTRRGTQRSPRPGRTPPNSPGICHSRAATAVSTATASSPRKRS